MKTSELIDLLDRRLEKHGDREVFVTWEGQLISLSPKEVYLTQNGDLILDANECFYKAAHAMDPTEGDDEE